MQKYRIIFCILVTLSSFLMSFPVFSQSVQNNSTSADDISETSQTTNDDLDDFFIESTTPDPDISQDADLDDFFIDENQTTEEMPVEVVLEPDGDQNTSLNGSVDIKTGYRFNHDSPTAGRPDHRGLSKAEIGVNLEFRHQISDQWAAVISGKASHDFVFRVKGKDEFPENFLDENESELELDEAYFRGTLSEYLDIKMGRQIVVWGKSDNLRVTDILNPLDLREPGLTDIEDLRLPLMMTRLDYYYSNLTLSGYLIHERRSNRFPVFGSAYYFFPIDLADESDPSDHVDNTEFAFSVSATFQGMDIALYLADVYDNFPILIRDYQRIYERIQMIGVAANKTAGNFLFKGEAAYFNNLRISGYQSGNDLIENTKDYFRLDTLAGIEYSGFENTTVSLEVSDRWLINHDRAAQLSGQEDHTIQYALRASRTFLHEVLEITCLASFYGESADNGGFFRVQGTYDYTDNIAITLGGVVYQSGPGMMLKKIGENDTLFMNIRYSF